MQIQHLARSPAWFSMTPQSLGGDGSVVPAVVQPLLQLPPPRVSPCQVSVVSPPAWIPSPSLPELVIVTVVKTSACVFEIKIMLWQLLHSLTRFSDLLMPLVNTLPQRNRDNSSYCFTSSATLMTKTKISSMLYWTPGGHRCPTPPLYICAP